jgi:C4-type Zn-finger protein
MRPSGKERKSNMNKYNKDRLCPKCGEGGVTTSYRRFIFNEVDVGKMVRFCQNCGYGWNEHPLDVDMGKEAT